MSDRDLRAPGGEAQPLIVVWRVTERCDLACRYCEFNRHQVRSRRSAQAAAVLAFGAILRDYAVTTGRTVHLSFLGGEPLLWRPLRAVAAALKHDLGLSTGLTTNGTRLHLPGLHEHLVRDYDQLTISVDGPEAWHTTCREAPGLWARLRAGVTALAALKAQRGHGPLLRVNTVLMRSNVRGLEGLCAELARWGVEEVTFNSLGGSAGEAFYEQQRLRPADIHWLRTALPGLRQRLGPQGLCVRGSARYLARLERHAQAVPWPVDDCQPGATFLFVDEHGRLGPCDATTAGYGVPVSDIRSAADVAGLPLRLAQHRQRERLAACADCRSTAVFGKFAGALAGTAP